MQFDFDDVQIVEFGVGINGHTFYTITVDADVQDALQEMVSSTIERMGELDDNPPEYEASEKYEGTEYLTISLSHDYVEVLRELHEANNLPLNGEATSDPASISSYFARLTDGQDETVTAVRRASQFKGIVKNRLIHFVTDAMKLVEDNVFKLDHNFDFLVEGETVHILRPKSFVLFCQIQGAILEAVTENVAEIKRDVQFVDFDNIEEYASKHPRGARYLASIRSQPIDAIDKNLLRKACRNNGIGVQTVNGKLTVEDGHILDFLEVLDRRRLEIELVKDDPERFRAPSRVRLQ